MGVLPVANRPSVYQAMECHAVARCPEAGRRELTCASASSVPPRPAHTLSTVYMFGLFPALGPLTLWQTGPCIRYQGVDRAVKP